MDSFKTDLQGTDWTFATQNNDANLGFEAFLWFFNTTLDKHAPIKEFTKKEEKDKLKPYVTKGIKKCMSVRDKIYKQMIKEKDQLIKTEKHKKFKKYRNKVTDLLKTSKQAHYHNYFEENKKNCRALWIGITKFSILKTKIKQILPYFKMVKQSQIKNILLKISTISSQVLAKNYKKTSHLLKSIFRAS